jgi:hypothetical protein
MLYFENSLKTCVSSEWLCSLKQTLTHTQYRRRLLGFLPSRIWLQVSLCCHFYRARPCWRLRERARAREREVVWRVVITTTHTHTHHTHTHTHTHTTHTHTHTGVLQLARRLTRRRHPPTRLSRTSVLSAPRRPQQQQQQRLTAAAAATTSMKMVCECLALLVRQAY